MGLETKSYQQRYLADDGNYQDRNGKIMNMRYHTNNSGHESQTSVKQPNFDHELGGSNLIKRRTTIYFRKK